MRLRFIGIDPGYSGGIGVITVDPETRTESAEAYKMPRGNRDLLELLAYLKKGVDDDISVWLEQVHSMHGQGVKSTWTFAEHFGALKMALTAEMGGEFIQVRPQIWQKELGCLTKGDKNVTKLMATRLFPRLKITHAIADALLVAHYGRLESGWPILPLEGMGNDLV